MIYLMNTCSEPFLARHVWFLIFLDPVSLDFFISLTCFELSDCPFYQIFLHWTQGRQVSCNKACLSVTMSVKVSPHVCCGFCYCSSKDRAQCHKKTGEAEFWKNTFMTKILIVHTFFQCFWFWFKTSLNGICSRIRYFYSEFIKVDWIKFFCWITIEV